MAGVHKQITLPAEEISISAGHPLLRWQWIAGGTGLIALVAAAGLGVQDSRQFFFSYLVAFLFCLTLGLGAMAFVLIQFLTRAGWSVAVRRLAEHIMGALPVVALLFIPLLFGVNDLYSWFNAETVAHDPLLQGKSAYLNPTFFYLRIAVYLVSWSALGLWFRGKSIAQDAVGGTRITRTLQNLSAPAIVWFAVTLTYATFDLIMSLDPHWFSTVFGVYIFGGSFMSVLALMILLILFLQRHGLLTHIVSPEHLHDLSKLMFGFVVFWAYIAFSQFMLIWYGNIPEETLWFAHRWHHGWQYASVLLAAGHFVIPFFLLISRPAKRNKTLLRTATLWLLAMHYLDLYWLVMPVFQTEGLHPHLLDLLTLVGLGGLSLSAVLHLMTRPSLVPKADPRLAESLSFENL